MPVNINVNALFNDNSHNNNTISLREWNCCLVVYFLWIKLWLLLNILEIRVVLKISFFTKKKWKFPFY